MPEARRWRGLRSRTLLINWLAVLLAVTVGVGAIGLLAPPVRADNLLYDLALRLTRRSPDPRILIVAIDEPSLSALGRWPWRREVHARAVQQLTQGGAAAIAYDVLFPEAGPAADDAALARAVRGNGRLALPVLLEVPGANGRPAEWRLPVLPLAEAAAGLGHVVIRPDRDGVVRGTERLTDARGREFPQLAEVLAALARHGKVARGWRSDMVAVQSAGRDLIAFAGPPGSYPQVSFADVLAGRLPAELLRGRIVLVGATAAGLGDRFSTPMSATQSTMPGVELLANRVDNLLHASGISVASPAVWLGFSLLPVWALMLSLFLLGPRINLWLGGLLALAVLAVTMLALVAARLWLPPALALLAIGIIYPLWGWRRLALASNYMGHELQSLRAEGGIFGQSWPDVAGDPIARQIAFMHAAITDVRDLRRFVSQSLESLPDAAVVAGLDGRVVIANEAAGALFRWRLGAALAGQPLGALLQCLQADAVAGDGAPLGAPGVAVAAAELQLADGTSLDVRVVPFHDSNQQPLGWIARFADITGLRAAEREREDTLRLLTHDMRAPQASILAVLDAEAAAVPPVVAQRLQHYARQTLRLADNFVHLARAKSSAYAQEIVNLPDCLLDAADDLWPLARRHGIAITTDLPEGEVLIRGDRALITRAISNILGNAINYSPDGSEVQATVASADGQGLCTIADHGRGIAAADLPGIFEAFRRSAPSAPQRGEVGGSGLGLAFVKTVTERHGGHVDVTSEPGRGTTFRLSLPLAEAQPAASNNRRASS